MPNEKKIKLNVKFYDAVEMLEYKKHDCVFCSNPQPRRSMSKTQKRSIKCQTTQEIMGDPQWALQAKLGMTRARAVGILMDDFDEFADVDEVHIVLGPRGGTKLRFHHIEYLWDNPRAETCYEEVIPHVPGKFGRRDNIMCITMPIELKDIDASSWTLGVVMTSFLQRGLTGWTLTPTRVQESISTPLMASHQPRLWWTWDLTHSMSLPRHMCWTTLHQYFHWESDAWNKATPLFGPMGENPT